METYKLPCLAAAAAILLAVGAPAHAQTTVEQSSCSFGWLDAAQTKTGWVCTRVHYPAAPVQPPATPPEPSGSSSPPREKTQSGVTILRGGS